MVTFIWLFFGDAQSTIHVMEINSAWAWVFRGQDYTIVTCLYTVIYPSISINTEPTDNGSRNTESTAHAHK